LLQGKLSQLKATDGDARWIRWMGQASGNNETYERIISSMRVLYFDSPDSRAYAMMLGHKIIALREPVDVELTQYNIIVQFAKAFYMTWVRQILILRKLCITMLKFSQENRPILGNQWAVAASPRFANIPQIRTSILRTLLLARSEAGEGANAAPGGQSSVSIGSKNVNCNADELKILAEFPKDRMNNKQNSHDQTARMILSTIS
jgi:hypothetical protein